MAVSVCSPPPGGPALGRTPPPLEAPASSGAESLCPPRPRSTAPLPAPTPFRLGFHYHGFLSPRFTERWALFSPVCFLWVTLFQPV